MWGARTRTRAPAPPRQQQQVRPRPQHPRQTACLPAVSAAMGKHAHPGGQLRMPTTKRSSMAATASQAAARLVGPVKREAAGEVAEEFSSRRDSRTALPKLHGHELWWEPLARQCAVAAASEVRGLLNTQRGDACC